MSELGREEITSILGEVDDELAAEIVATGATADELIEAVEAVKTETDLGEPAPEPSTGRAAVLRGLVLELLCSSDNDEG
jgi:hypothetical protein